MPFNDGEVIENIYAVIVMHITRQCFIPQLISNQQ